MICPICLKPHENKVVCSPACHMERLRRMRLDPVVSAVARARISFNVRRSHAEPETKAKMSAAWDRRRARAL